MPDLDSVSDKVHASLSEIIREEQASMVTKWVVLAEVIGDDGVAQMWSLSSERLSMWDRLGLVEFHSRTIQPEVDDDDD